MNRIRWAVLLVIALSSPPAAAQVARVLFVVVATDKALERDALGLQLSASQLLKRDPRLELVDAPGTAIGAAPAEATAALEEVQGLVAQVEYAAARTRAEAGLAALRGADFRVVRGPYLELLVRLARIKFALQADDSGAAQLADAFALDGSIEAPRDLNTRERAWFEVARKASVIAPKASPVTVESSGAEGWVWLDGRFIGVTPAPISGVAAGRHFLTFAAPGVEPLHRSELLGKISRVRLEAASSEQGRSYLSLVSSLAAAFRKNAPEPAAQNLRGWARTSDVIAVALSGAGATLKATVVRVSSAGASPVVSIDLSEPGLWPNAISDAALASFEATIVPGVSAPASALEAPPAQIDAAATRSKGPAIAMFAVAAAAAAVGTGLVLAGQGRYREAPKVPQASVALYTDTIEKGEQLTGGGVAAFGASAVAIGVGIALAW